MTRPKVSDQLLVWTITRDYSYCMRIEFSSKFIFVFTDYDVLKKPHFRRGPSAEEKPQKAVLMNIWFGPSVITPVSSAKFLLVDGKFTRRVGFQLFKKLTCFTSDKLLYCWALGHLYVCTWFNKSFSWQDL